MMEDEGPIEDNKDTNMLDEHNDDIFNKKSISNIVVDYDNY